MKFALASFPDLWKKFLISPSGESLDTQRIRIMPQKHDTIARQAEINFYGVGGLQSRPRGLQGVLAVTSGVTAGMSDDEKLSW